MTPAMQVPQLLDLDGLPVEVVSSQEPGGVSVSAGANDGSLATLDARLNQVRRARNSFAKMRGKVSERNLSLAWEGIRRLSVGSTDGARVFGHALMARHVGVGITPFPISELTCQNPIADEVWSALPPRSGEGPPPDSPVRKGVGAVASAPWGRHPRHRR